MISVGGVGQPRVSVCIPTYNMGRFTGGSIWSVLKQTYHDFELIICDDCSTDDTAAVVKKFNDPRIRFFTNECTLGIFGNFNRTIEHARGRYIKFLCTDDRIHPQYLEKAVALFETFPRVGIVTAFHIWIDANDRVISRHAPSRLKGPSVVAGQEMLRRASWRHNEIGTPSHAMLRREVFERCGRFNLEYRHAADWELWLRVLSQYDAGFLRDYLIEIRIHPQQQSRIKEATLLTAQGVFRIAQSHCGTNWWWRQILAIHNAEGYFWGAVIQCFRGDWLRGWRMLRLVAQNASCTLLAAYVTLHFPVRLWHSLRRHYCLRTGKIWET